MVQVGSRHTKDETAQLDRILRNLGYSLLPFVIDKVAGVDSYRVQVGPYASRELPDKAAQKLELEGFQPFVFPAPEATVRAPESPPAPGNGDGQPSSLLSSTASPKGPTRSGRKAPEAEGPTGSAPPPKPKLPAVSALPPPQAAPPRTQPPSGPAPSPQQSTFQQAANGRGGKVVDQVLASTSEADVIKKVKLLEGQGFRAFVEPPRAGEKMFRALVGPFDSILEAEEAGRKLSASGTKPYIRSWRSAQAE